MEVVVGPENCEPPARGSAVTIGAYDGVHDGHRFVIAELLRMAAERDLTSVVLTFDRHPATVVRPQSAPLELTPLEQKLELLAGTGVDRTLVVPFDEERANETAEDFVEDVLVRALNSKLVVVGEDFHFGHGRKGNVRLLREMGREDGFEVLGLQLEEDGEGEPVSSTRIRRLLAEGRVEDASRLLGRPYEVRGIVEKGDGRGGPLLGFPTANIAVRTGTAMPADGVYAGRYVRPDGSAHAAAISLGVRPTFGNANLRKLEAHLLDFDGDLYGEKAAVSFVARLHDERRFESVEDLVEQMRLDVAQAREILTDT